MALIRVEQLPGHSTRRGERGKREHTRELLGFSNSATDDPDSIASSRRCPQVGKPDPFDPTMVIVDVNVQRHVSDDVNNLWRIGYTSSTEFDGDQDVSPLDLPAEINWYSEQFERYTNVDVNGKVIRTTAGTIFPMKIDDSRWVIDVSKNLDKPPRSLLNFANVLNSAQISVDGISFPKRTLMCKGTRIEPEVTETWKGQRLTFRKVKFQLHYRKEGWKAREPNVDFVELSNYSAERKVRKDGKWVFDKYKENVYAMKPDPNKPKGVLKRTLIHSKGDIIYETKVQRVKIRVGSPAAEVTEPWPLAKDGSRLPDDYKPEDVSYIEADVYRPVDFSALPLK
jgi:hypothetical protein